VALSAQSVRRGKLFAMARPRRTIAGANGASGGGSGFTGGMISNPHPDRIAKDRAERELVAAVNKSLREGELAIKSAVGHASSLLWRLAGKRMTAGASPTSAVEATLAELQFASDVDATALDSLASQKEELIVAVADQHRLKEMRRDARLQAKAQVSSGRKSSQ
jgi:hypothetical protein